MEHPWKGKLKTTFTQIVDCLAHAPGILESVHLLFRLDQIDQADLCHALILECWHVDERLGEILNKIQQATPDPLYWPVQSRMDFLSDSESLRNFFPVVFHFADIETANSLILLWAIRVMLWSGLCNLYRVRDLGHSIFDHATTPVFPCISDDEPSLPPLDHRRGYITMVHQVCQSVEYILEHQTLLAGPLSIAPALGIVLESLRGQPHYAREVKWLRAAVEVARQRGLSLLNYVR